jgi:hypothetical protein
MRFLVLRAYWMLIYFDFHLARGKFAALYRKVRDYPLSPSTEVAYPIEKVCAAIDMALIWYWKEVLCLQRSAATACLLKQHGVRAQMIIGTQQMPFRAHAWVEVEGRVINDNPDVREIYGVLDKC